MFLIVYYLIVSALAATCSESQTNCANEKCETVGKIEVCTECNAGNVPIDGTCTKVGDAKEKCKKAEGSTPIGESDTKCGRCEGVGIFLFMGGCYSTESTAGSSICTAAEGGKCTTCKTDTKYIFQNPAKPSTPGSECILCSDAAGANGYKGVANCQTCTAPAASGSSDSNKKAMCTACAEGYFVASSKTECTACTDNTNCAACTGSGDDKCTKCKASGTKPYFKKNDGDDPTGTCVAENACTNTHFPTTTTDSKKICALCSDATNGGIANCQECSKTGETVTCTTCTGTNKPNTAKTACLSCSIEGCTSCDKENVCAACNSGKYLTPTGQCVDNCPAGTYEATATTGSSKICALCHPSCSKCTDDAESSCTACYPGSVLNHGSTPGKGTCIPECTGKYLENCADGQCTASIAGSKYCSRCKSGFVPVDGLCVSAGTRAAPAGCTPSTTTAGTCESCKDAYFLESGGCYQAAVYPGNMLCTTTDNNGKCTKCANGQEKDNNGSCPACHPTCATCGTGKPQECKTCFSGYYFDATNKACKKCSETSGTITGVENCISCEKPSNNQGSVTCYVKTSGGGSGDNSTGGDSDSNLSSGAIAGISVAVVVVVGGLVGFLCWWFICRGKA